MDPLAKAACEAGGHRPHGGEMRAYILQSKCLTIAVASDFERVPRTLRQKRAHEWGVGIGVWEFRNLDFHEGIGGDWVAGGGALGPHRTHT